MEFEECDVDQCGDCGNYRMLESRWCVCEDCFESGTYADLDPDEA